MTTHLTKIWWDLNKDKLVEQVIPEAEIYKREWVGLTQEEIFKLSDDIDGCEDWHLQFARAIEAKLRHKNTVRMRRATRDEKIVNPGVYWVEDKE